MSRKVHCKVVLDAYLNVDEGVNVAEVIKEGDLVFRDIPEEVADYDFTVESVEVTDSR